MPIAQPGSRRVMLAAARLFLIVLENSLPKSRPGFVGLRTPCSLSDPENWIAICRYTVRLMTGDGAALILDALAPIDGGASPVAATLLVVATTPVIYSI